MQRLVKPVSDGGVPYNNFDLYKFLQENHLISYSSFLDGMNDEPSSGIILYGCTFVTSSAQDCVFDFTNSMVYLQGDFRQASPLIASQSFGISSLKFYLVPDTDTPNEQRVFKVTDLETDIATYNYFNYSISKPTDTEYIEIEIKNGLNITSRHLSRIMRYYNAEEKQIFMTRNKNFFDLVTGLGFGEMKGFQLCNGQNSSQNLSGKYLIGYNPPPASPLTIGWNTSTYPNTFTNSSQNPAVQLKQVTITENYNYLKNTGGNDKVFLFADHLPPHSHGDMTGLPSNDLSHSHEITVSRDIFLNGSKSNPLNQLAYGNPGKYGVGNTEDAGGFDNPLTLTPADYNLIFPPTNSYFGVIGKKLQPSTTDYSRDYKLISTMKTPRGGFTLPYLNLNPEETNWEPLKDSNGNWIHKGDNISWEVTNPINPTNYVQLPLFQTTRNDVKLENHVHLIDKFQFSAASLPYGLSHDNLPPYYVVAYYQKI